MDLMEEGILNLGAVRGVVLDEADRMLDKGFENEIRKIVGNCLPQRNSATDSLDTHRQTLLFSATFPTAIRALANSFLYEPMRITVGSEDLQANSDISIRVDVLDDGRMKEDRLVRVLREEGFGKKDGKGKGEGREKCLVFALYKKEVGR
jgi:ATP-dependent RNA helicase DBP3